MPKLQHNFLQGKMNKDLDERLVPNGQYRDAQNIQVSTSEGSDVGAVENVLGNTKQAKKTAVVNWDAGFGLTNPKCIGTIADTQNEKIYWFITSDLEDVIAEFDQATGFVAPVLVDTSHILRFNAGYLITGVNLLEGMLMWTDGLNEPYKINIERFKAGSTDFSTHTSVYGRAFIKSDVTVIKKAPSTSPVATTRATKKAGSGNGCGISPLTTTHNFAIAGSGSNFSLPETGDSVTVNFTTEPDWAVNDVIVLSASELNDNNFEDEFRLRLEIDSITQVSGPSWDVACTILSISQSLLNQAYTWSALLEEEKPMFGLKFPRFAYRWKYNDGEYSTYSPWTKPIFIGDEFDYKTADAYNSGMSNNLRYLQLGSFETAPADVVEIDILYKESNSTAVYKVDTIPISQTTFTVESELIGGVVAPIQLLRPWDNVPRKAKAQEIIGNRLVYGNYTQNYTVSTKPELTLSSTSTAHSGVKSPEESVKSDRTYQVGVVYSDEYGRETPVFTSENASVTIPIKNAEKETSLAAQVTTSAPAFATHFKYFIKETANEYYNLALDRFYKADDGNIWLSFPSAERNKLVDGDFLLLKKKHDSDEAIPETVKYRVLDIKNEAPRDITHVRTKVAGDNVTGASGMKVGGKKFTFTGPTYDDNRAFADAWSKNLVARFRDGTNASGYYEVREGGIVDGTTDYSITLQNPLAGDASWMEGNVSFDIDLYSFEPKYKKEFQGKFFVKIHRTPSFDDYIINTLVQQDPAYNWLHNSNIFPGGEIFDDPANDLNDSQSYGWQEYGTTSAAYPPAPGTSTVWLFYAWHTNPGNTLSGDDWYDEGLEPGKFIKFDTGTDYYKIASVTTTRELRYNAANATTDDYGLKKVITFTTPLGSDVVDAAGTFQFKIYERSVDWADYLDNGVVLSSRNPAVFETEPRESAELDVYYEVTDAIPVAQHGNNITLDWFNCYSFGNGVESNRIRDDFNAPVIDKGVVVSATLEEPYAEEHRGSSLIFSGLFNSISGVNDLNQFIQAENITKDMNPVYGTIQKLHARDTDLTVLMEDKIFRVLANKDALYNADGNTNVTANINVLGQSVPYVGEFGISKNPESFASYGFRAYFTDKARGAVIRLSRDGITPISNKGMTDFFADEFKANSTPIIGGFDDYTGAYNIFLNTQVLSFKEKVDGWVTRLSYAPDFSVSLNNIYYSLKNGELWSHDNQMRSNFYGVQYDSIVEPIISDGPSSIKNYKTLSYEGDAGWVASVVTDQQDGEVAEWQPKEGIYFNFIKGLATTWDYATQSGSLDTSEFSVQGVGVYPGDPTSTNPVVLNFGFDINTSVAVGDILYIDRLGEITEIGAVSSVAADVIEANNSGSVTVETNDFVFVAKDSEINTSGIIGYYMKTTMTTSSGAKKELFAVNAEVFTSSE